MSSVKSVRNGKLTPREFEVLEHLALGESYKEISNRLGISAQTVNGHVKNLYRKLEVHSRARAVIHYMSWTQSSAE